MLLIIYFEIKQNWKNYKVMDFKFNLKIKCLEIVFIMLKLIIANLNRNNFNPNNKNYNYTPYAFRRVL